MLYRLIAAGFVFLCQAAAAFEIEDIEVEGLNRVAPGRVFEAQPLKVGVWFDESRTPEILNMLYETGLFEDVTLIRRGDKLVFQVVERPGIAAIQIVGNEVIGEEQLLEGLAQADIAIGLVFNRLAFDRLKEQLKEQYQAVGKYEARVNADVEQLSGNRISITINITEGEVAKIKRIRITGNRKISDKELLSKLQSGTARWYEFWSSKDDYSRAKLTGDLETLRDTYQDIGYLDFEVTDTRVSLSPDKRDIFVDVEVSEGGQYRVGRVSLSGDKVFSERELRKFITLRKGQIFSRSEALYSGDAIKAHLQNNGYAFAKVTPLPQTNASEGTIDVAFIIEPGDKTYVRRIDITGNVNTDDVVFRRELRQLEGAEYSAGKVELSRRRLQRLPYVESVAISDQSVEDADNQIDLDINVVERYSGSFNIGAGYSDSAGAVLTLGINQDNFLGTGNRVGFAFSNNEVDTNYTFSFFDPFHTLDGIGRLWSISYRSVDYSANDISNVLSDESEQIRLRLNYSIPISENDVLNLGGRLEDVSFDLSPSSRAILNLHDTYGSYARYWGNPDPERYEIASCIDDNGGDFQNFALDTSLNYDTRDSALFTTDGSEISASLQFYTPLSDAEYFKTDYSHRRYFPLDRDKDFVLSAHGQVSYARAYNNSCIPFYDRYYAGGSRTVRGYLNNSLGPRDDDNDATGGNFRVLNNWDLFFPTDFLYDSKKFRASVFVDAGNVFRHADDFDVGELRGSYGLQIQWLTALGGISFSFASHFNDSSDDQTERFQFNLGTSF